MKKVFRKILKILGLTIGSIFSLVFAIAIYNHFQKPSLTRVWDPSQERMPHITWKDSNIVTIDNVRNFSYTSETDFTKNYYSRDYDLRKLKNVYFVLVPFNDGYKAAHGFLSFEFEDGVYLSASVEARKELGEKYSVYSGLVSQYELMYVLADEGDVISLRANQRKNDVYLYKTSIQNHDTAVLLFTSFIERADKLSKEPEFYNTLTNSCITNILRHINTILPNNIPWTIYTILPADSDMFAYAKGFLQTDGKTFEELKRSSQINAIAKSCLGNQNFGACIRNK